MKNLRTFLAAASMLFLSLSAHAQYEEVDEEDRTHLEVGLQITPGITNLDIAAKGVIDYGITLDWRVPSNPWMLGTGITYHPRSIAQEAVFMVGSSYATTHMTDRRDYSIVQFPLQISRRIGNNEGAYMYAYAGPTANLLLKHTSSRTQDEGVAGPPLGPEFRNEYKMSNLSEAGFKPWNFGFVFGGSGHISLSERLFLGIDFRIRITKLANSIDKGNSENVSTVGLQFKCGYNVIGWR